MNRIIIVFLFALMSARAAEKNEIRIVNQCSRAVGVRCGVLPLKVTESLFFMNILPGETARFKKPLVIDVLTIGSRREIIDPRTIFLGDQIFIVPKEVGGVTISAIAPK